MDTDGVSWLRGPILGKGAFCSVFLATLRYPLSRKTARCFPPKMAVRSAHFDASDSLQKEKKVLCNLRGCPHVVQCLGEQTTVGTNGDMVYNVLLEHASGGTLAHSIKNSNGSALPKLEARHYTKCPLQGLCEVHDSGYVHCDLKPDNVLLFPGKNGRGYLAKLGDFGLARRSVRQSKRQRLVWSSYLRGTAMYMAPETVVDHVQELQCILTAEMLLNHPFVQGFDDVEFGEEGEEEDGFSEESLSYDSECSLHYSSFTFTSEEEDFDCVGETVDDDGLFQALSSSPAMQRSSVIAIPADA